MTKVLITGATGYVGKNLVNAYASAGFEVIALARNADNLADLARKHIGLQTCAADVTNYQQVFDAISSYQPDIIVHAAALPRRADVSEEEFAKVNISGIENVATAITQLTKPIHLCFISSGSVFDQNLGKVDANSARDLTNAFPKSKTDAENIFLKVIEGKPNITTSIIYPPIVLDETQSKGIIPRAILEAINGRNPQNNAPANAHVNFISANDIGAAIMAITTKQQSNFERYPVTAFRLPVMELLAKIGNPVQGGVKFKSMPHADETALMALMPKDFEWQGVDKTIKAIAKRLLLEQLATLDEPDRAKLLYTGNNRALVTSYGANTTFYSGNVREGNCAEEKLEGIILSLIKRKNRIGAADGIGAIGGQTDLADHADLTDPIEITKVTLRRELTEETADFGVDITALNFDTSKLVHVDLAVIDDAYIIRNGRGSAIDPHCYLYKLDAPISTLPRTGEVKATGEGELLEITLFEALKRSGANDLTYDYRYPHEYFAAWKLAADLLGNKGPALQKLAAEVQTSILQEGGTHKIDLEAIARKMAVEFTDMDRALGVNYGTVQNMQDSIDTVIANFSAKPR